MVATASTSVPMYCEPCGDDRDFARVERARTFPFRGEDFPILEPLLVCPVCGATQPDLTDGIDSLRLVYDEYRRRHRLLQPEQIQTIREQYGLSREAFASILGMSPATLYRYESGCLQDELHDSMIFACENPATMQRLIDRFPQRLSDLQRQRFKEALARLLVEPAATGH